MWIEREEPLTEVLLRRHAPCFAVLDEALNVLAAEPRLSSFLAEAGYVFRHPSLPAELESVLQRLVSTSSNGGSAVCGALIMRATPLHGSEGSRFALSLERVARRTPLRNAAERFNLTKRETAVLKLVLQGLCAREIAVRLQIAHATVGEYFKHLSVKINAHSRAEMIARVLDYTDRA